MATNESPIRRSSHNTQIQSHTSAAPNLVLWGHAWHSRGQGRPARVPRDCRRNLTLEEAGIVSGHDPRRIPGIRRDEVAQIIGPDTEYYADFERGALDGPVPTWMEEEVAEVLLLDDMDRDEFSHLLRVL